MRIEGEIKEASFVARLTRFSALVEMEGRRETVFLPNSGRMKELLVAGRPVYVVPRGGPHRSTAFDLALVSLGSQLVSVDARVPNILVYEGLVEGSLSSLTGYGSFQREVVFGESRFDLLLKDGPRRCYVEVKSVTLVQGGRARFPDAPTQRGTKHLRHLLRAKKEGHRAAIVFTVQREDATSFTPNDETDPEFGKTLREVVAQGVEAYAYGCRVSLREIKIDREIAICL
ncbi:MAG: DNA/RNA nuclease SfsA [Chloroflexota bacterium]|nr:DNA/RNA nuclease SfsA [Chloroflexota bacterium]